MHVKRTQLVRSKTGFLCAARTGKHGRWQQENEAMIRTVHETRAGQLMWRRS